MDRRERAALGAHDSHGGMLKQYEDRVGIKVWRP
jgi:hypothetical protein